MKIILLSLVILFISCKQNSISSNLEESNELTHLSKRLLSQRKLDSAELVLRKALSLDDGNYEAYNNLAFLKNQRGEVSTEIIKFYEKALSIKPDYDVSIYSLGNYYHSIEDYENAIVWLTKIIELPIKKEISYEQIQHAYLLRGECYKYLWRFEEAVQDLRESLKMNSGGAEAFKELADCFFYWKKDILYSIQLYSKAISINPDYYQAYLGRAQCYEQSDPPLKTKAVSDYVTALKINPDAKDIYNTKSPLLEMVRIRRK